MSSHRACHSAGHRKADLECKVRAGPRGDVQQLPEWREETGKLAWGPPFLLGSGAPMESDELLEQQKEKGENVLSWKQEEEGVPRERE